MRNSILTVLAFGMISLQTYGQTGIKLGANMSKIGVGLFTKAIDGSLLNTGTFTSGFEIGIWHKRALNDKNAIGIELVYAQKNDIWQDNNKTGKATTNMTMLNLPVYLNHHISNKISLDLGISTNYMLGSDVTEFNGYNIKNRVRDRGFNYNKVNTGLLLGANFHLGAKSSMGFRYEYGLSTFTTYAGGSVQTTQLRSLQLSLNLAIK